MFLDDELLKICQDAEIKTEDHVREIARLVYQKCEDYYKPKLSPTMTYREIKATLDRTFNLFDSFVNSALKSDNPVVVILGKMFQKHTFKKAFLSDEKLSQVYNKL